MPGLDALALIISGLASTVFGANALYLGTYAVVLGNRVDGCSMLSGRRA